MHTFLVLLDTLKAALLFAPKADVRYYLNGVQFERRHDSRRMVATDGYRLILVNLPDLGERMGMQHELDAPISANAGKVARYIVPRDVIEKAVKAFAKKAYIVVRCDKETATVTVSGIAAKLIDGRFPEYERIIPREVSGETMQFNAAYLYDCAKARKLLGTGADFDNVPLAHNGEGAALITLSPDAIAVVMGIRGKAEVAAGPPKWYTGTDPRTMGVVVKERETRIGTNAVHKLETEKCKHGMHGITRNHCLECAADAELMA